MFATPAVNDLNALFSPSLVIDRDRVLRNIDRMIRIAGSVTRLRPHCKTHKMDAVVRLELAKGITKHKCATLAEAEMLARAGVRDIVLAYNIVGPNIGRVTAFLQTFPDCKLIVTADDATMAATLGSAMSAAGLTVGVLVDLDSGLGRTGIAPGPAAVELFETIAATPGLTAEGFHWYDGQHHQVDLGERKAAVLGGFQAALEVRDELMRRGKKVPRIVCGGTGSFPVFADLTDAEIELSPGTCVLHDSGYGTIFPDLDFEPAAFLLTRVVSRPASDRVTCDLGNKAVASDPPKGARAYFPALPDAEQIVHNEEHLVLKTPLASQFRPGDSLWAIPKHICPTSALYPEAYVVADGEVVDRWEVTARNRSITL